jgi:hypothetical protein
VGKTGASYGTAIQPFAFLQENGPYITASEQINTDQSALFLESQKILFVLPATALFSS